jgi:mono/diheme cytochrome c family protein
MALMAILPATTAGVQKTATQQTPAAQLNYNRDVRTILAAHCFACHGVDSNKRQAGSRLDNADGAYKTLASGKSAIAPGDLKNSERIDRINRRDALQMPLVASAKKLTLQQVAILQRWVAQGGK